MTPVIDPNADRLAMANYRPLDEEAFRFVVHLWLDSAWTESK